MAQRFGGSSGVHQRDSRSALFGGYTGGNGDTSRRSGSAASPMNNFGNRYSYSQPTAATSSNSTGVGGGGGGGGFRAATPNTRGQYSDAVLNELESQNDAEVAGILGKVRVLRQLTTAMGDEIRDSAALADRLNDSFERAGVRLRGTASRMLLMARRSGIPWRVWLGFFAAVVLLFVYVWLF